MLRLEQLAPFPKTPLREQLSRFPNADVIWCQEEPQNMGPWNYVGPRIEALIKRMDGVSKRPRYVGRTEAASPAAGSNKVHHAEQAGLVDKSLTL